MFTLHLSSGWINACKTKQPLDPLHPLLQIINVAKVSPSKTGQNLFHVLVSDGIHSVPALLHPQIKEFGTTWLNTVVKVTEHSLISLPSGPTLALSKLELITNLAYTLGSPKLWSQEPEFVSPTKPLNSSSSTNLKSDLKCLLPQQDRSTNFSDVTLFIDGHYFCAHRLILTARSPYFHALFLNGMSESGSQQLDLCGDLDAFKRVLTWIYTDEVELPQGEYLDDPSPIWDLWETATFFCLQPLAAIVEEHIISLLTPENICQFWSKVRSIEAPSLNVACKHYFFQNLPAIVPTLGFLSLDRSLMFDIFFGQDSQDPLWYVFHPAGPPASQLPHQPPEPHDLSTISPSCKTLALTRWFAAHEPQRLKRKLEESFPIPESRRIRFKESCSV